MTTSSDFELTILYGSQTGNAEFLAYNISESAKASGISVELHSLNDALAQGVTSWQRLLIVTSTHDNGHMPDNANGFWEWLKTCPEKYFDGLPFAVLAIGDSMYDDFCKAGKDFDQKLQDLGATSIIERIDCDVDFDMTSEKWIRTFLEMVPGIPAWNPSDFNSDVGIHAADFIESVEDWHKAKIINSRRLTSQESQKNVVHLDIELSGDFTYIPGDSIDIEIENNSDLITQWQQAFPAVAEISFRGEKFPFEEALRSKLELRLPQPSLLHDLMAVAKESPAKSEVEAMLEIGDRQTIDKWLWGKDVLEIVNMLCLTPTDLPAIINSLRPLQLRSYSIASSPKAKANHLSLTVSVVAYDKDGRRHFGAATKFLEDSSVSGRTIRIRRLPTHEFALPTDTSPVIMIGPGVGVAPFVGFLQHLETERATNRSWLFFGDQHRKTDSLYQEELDAWLEAGVLTRLNRAFSRDQAEKHYVQDDLLSHADDIRTWVEEGAYIYVCGDKNRMAHDVENALISILSAGNDSVSGRERLELLKDSGRYAKDVY